MNRSTTKHLAKLYRGLVDAAKSLGSRSGYNPGLRGRDPNNVDPDTGWTPEREQVFRLVLPPDMVFHLEIRLERLGGQEHQRVMVMGRRLKGLDYATGGTQRATFNSDHTDDEGYWLRPNLSPDEKNALQKRLPGPCFPRWDGTHIQLGSVQDYVCLRRFLVALAAIEHAKGSWPSGPLPFDPGLENEDEKFDPTDLADIIEITEGRLRQVTVSRRARCMRLLGEAQEHFRGLNRDGKLHCQICRWYPKVATRSEIVQIHHMRQLRVYPRGGRRLTLDQAIQNLVPLCPNCHRVLESHPESGCYQIDELTNLVRAKRT